MALTAAQQWWVRTGGNTANGGGFDSTISGAGVNRSDQDAPFITFNGTSVTASNGGTGATITLSGHTVTSDDTGNVVKIAGGTNFVTGYFAIVSVNAGANTWTLDRNCTSGAGAAMTGRMGGALASPFDLAAGDTQLAAGHTVNVRGSGSMDGSPDYSAGGSFYTFPSGNATDGPIAFVGYNGRPCIQGGTQSLTFYICSMLDFSNMKFVAAGSSTYPDLGYFNGSNFRFTDCIIDSAGYDLRMVNGGANRAILTWFKNTGSTSSGTYGTASLTEAIACVFSDQRGICIGERFIPQEGLLVDRCIFRGNTEIAVKFNYSTYNPSNVQAVTNSIFYDNASDGIYIIAADLTPNTMPLFMDVRGSVFVNNGGYGINFAGALARGNAWTRHYGGFGYNAFYNNTSGAMNNISARTGDVTLTGDPFIDAGSGDFSLNNTAGAGADCRAAGFPGSYTDGLTTGYLDIGAAQHQDSGGGGGSSARIFGSPVFG